VGGIVIFAAAHRGSESEGFTKACPVMKAATNSATNLTTSKVICSSANSGIKPHITVVFTPADGVRSSRSVIVSTSPNGGAIGPGDIPTTPTDSGVLAVSSIVLTPANGGKVGGIWDVIVPAAANRGEVPFGSAIGALVNCANA
jgi:hypothetical protein